MRYDGKTLINYTAADGLAQSWVDDMFADGNGGLWLKTVPGVMHFDGEVFTQSAEFAGMGVHDIERDAEGGGWQRIAKAYGVLLPQTRCS